MSTSDTTNFEYQDRVVAFIDILGFAKLVKDSEGNLAARAKVTKMIAAGKEFERFVREDFPSLTATVCPPSFVLSMEKDKIFYLIRETGKLCRHLFTLGFPFRGAISVGSLYHDEEIVVGPALDKVRQIESSLAVYPRVIVDEVAIKYWRYEFRTCSAHPHLESVVKLDCDGQNFIDIFSSRWVDFGHLDENNVDFLPKALEVIQRGLAEHKGDAKIITKFTWLNTEYKNSGMAR
jgi:hypothetical protein